MMSEVERNRILLGDCLELLKSFPDNTFTACVTDPPYGLSAPPDMREVLRHWLAGDDYEHRGAGFMGKEWDSFVPGPKVWEEVMRVLKPGGHILAFEGTRTYDLGVTAMRIAGAEIRDKIDCYCEMELPLAWVHGQGFPKSLNISKAIDKVAGADREVVGYSRGVCVEDDQGFGGIARGGVGVKQNGADIPVTAAATDEAKKWEGYGTALKPAHEPIASFAKGDAPPLGNDVPFRYVAKTSTRERNLGCNHLFWRHDGTDYEKLTEEEHARLAEENARRKGEEGFVPARLAQGNVHPTVKPMELVRYLVRLVKMPGDNLVLDPFVGSGTTAAACVLEGCDFVGIEKDPVAVEIAEARVRYFRCLGEKGLKK